MTPGFLGRPVMQSNNPPKSSRVGDYAGIRGRSSNDERASALNLAQGLGNGTKGWGDGNIWSADYRPSTRESSRTRETSSLMPPTETNAWERNRLPWVMDANSNATGQNQQRTNGVSPIQRGSNQLQNNSLLEPSAQNPTQFFSTPRNVSAVGAKQLPGAFDPATGFGSARPADSVIGSLEQPARPGEERPRYQDARSSWADIAALSSPSDEPRNGSSNDYFGPSSGAGSRNGSLPPSRHGSEPFQLQPNGEAYQIVASSRPAASYSGPSNPRMYNEKQQNAQPGEAMAIFSRLSLDTGTGTEASLHLRRPSTTTNGSTTASKETSFHRNTLSDQPRIFDELPQNNNANGSLTPDDNASRQFTDQLRAYRFSDRGSFTPNSVEFRPASSYYSAGGTPPVFDGIYGSRNDPSRHAANTTILERKLHRLQQEQQLAFRHNQWQQMNMLAAQYRDQYNPFAPMYQYPNGYPVNGMNLAMGAPPAPPMQPAVPAVAAVAAFEAPNAPRESDSNTVRSAFLGEFIQSYKTRRYELKDLYGYVVEFSGDQVGSRFIQQKLETANSDEKATVFKEILPDVMQLMQDVFGNYVIQKFFEHGDQNQKKILAGKMKGHVLALSLQMYGCRVVQKALEHVLTDQQASLVKELENHVMKCVKDQNGNHVIQKAIERVPAEHIQFVFNTFVGHTGQLAVHTYGCRVVQRMLERCEEPHRRMILQELHDCGSGLISDQYGNYVAQHIIVHGDLDGRNKLIEIVLGNLNVFSKHKFASNVVEKCLVYGTDEQRRQIMMKVVSKSEIRDGGLFGYIKCGYANYVVQKLLDTLNDEDYAYFLDQLKPEIMRARRTVPKKPVDAVEAKMHRLEGKPPTGNMATASVHSVNAASAGASLNATPPPIDLSLDTMGLAQTTTLLPSPAPTLKSESPQTEKIAIEQIQSIGGSASAEVTGAGNSAAVMQ